MALQDKKIMPPPWLAHREIERYSIGWRMGYGEDYIDRFGDWLDTLSPEERQIVLLSVLEGYTMREIASMLEMPQGTVSSKLSRSLKKLRLQLQDTDGSHRARLRAVAAQGGHRNDRS